MLGSQRSILFSYLISFKSESDEKSNQAIDELVKQAQELDLED